MQICEDECGESICKKNPYMFEENPQIYIDCI